jgi:hypothetical protein
MARSVINMATQNAKVLSILTGKAVLPIITHEQRQGSSRGCIKKKYLRFFS